MTDDQGSEGDRDEWPSCRATGGERGAEVLREVDDVQDEGVVAQMWASWLRIYVVTLTYGN